ncbi:DUF4259 domain-containing protein [Streptomyces sp. NPDC002133]|uniref:DUF4259 domain-containing protein n=1 Tax=Streptomyces sp. NPDC002133 TaxID=3154409 RepID=UPI003325EEFF
MRANSRPGTVHGRDVRPDAGAAAGVHRTTWSRRPGRGTYGPRCSRWRRGEHVEAPDADEALAAAALAAAGLPGGQPVDPVHGPEEPVPVLPGDLPALGVRAIDRILAPESELAELLGRCGRRGRCRGAAEHPRTAACRARRGCAGRAQAPRRTQETPVRIDGRGISSRIFNSSVFERRRSHGKAQ